MSNGSLSLLLFRQFIIVLKIFIYHIRLVSLSLVLGNVKVLQCISIDELMRICLGNSFLLNEEAGLICLCPLRFEPVSEVGAEFKPDPVGTQ